MPAASGEGVSKTEILFKSSLDDCFFLSPSLSLSLSVPLSSPSGAVDAIKRTAAVCARMLPLPRSRGRRLQKTKVGCVGVHPTAFRCQGQRWLPTKAMKNTLNNKAAKRLDAWSVVVSCFSFGHGEQNKKTAFCFYVFFFLNKNSFPS